MGKPINILLNDFTASVEDVDFSSDGQKIATASDDARARLWNAATGEHLRTLERHRSRVKSVHFSPDSKILASGSEDKTVRLWDVETGRQMRVLEGHKEQILSVRFSPDGQKIVSGGWDKMVFVWDATTGEQLTTLAPTAIVRNVRFSPDGREIVTDSGKVGLWNASTGKYLKTLTDYLGYGISFAPNGRKILTGGDDAVHLRPVDILGFRHKMLTGATGGWVQDVSYSPDGQTVASANKDGTVTVWNAVTGERLSSFVGHTSTVNKVTFSPDGRTLASCSGDGTVLLWEVPQP